MAFPNPEAVGSPVSGDSFGIKAWAGAIGMRGEEASLPAAAVLRTLLDPSSVSQATCLFKVKERLMRFSFYLESQP